MDGEDAVGVELGGVAEGTLQDPTQLPLRRLPVSGHQEAGHAPHQPLLQALRALGGSCPEEKLGLVPDKRTQKFQDASSG